MLNGQQSWYPWKTGIDAISKKYGWPDHFFNRAWTTSRAQDEANRSGIAATNGTNEALALAYFKTRWTRHTGT